MDPVSNTNQGSVVSPERWREFWRGLQERATEIAKLSPEEKEKLARETRERDKLREQETYANLSPEEREERTERDKRLEPLQGLRDLCDSSGW